MNKLFSIVLLSFASQQVVAQEQFTLTGKYTGSALPYIYLQYPNAKGVFVKDSSAVKDGRFTFNGEISGVVNGSLSGRTLSRGMDDPNTHYFFLEPGNIMVDVKENAFKEAKIKGGPIQTEMDALNLKKAPLKKQWEPFFKALDSVNKISNFKFQEMKEGLKPYYKEMEKIDFTYIDTHPGTYYSAYLLRGYSYSLPTEKLQAYYDGLDAKLKSTVAKGMGDELERRKIGVPGTKAFSFASTDITGAPFNLADYKGKYVLIDFWASWCLPCRKGNPHLKNLYAQYKDKGFEIVGVSDDDSKPDAWKKAVEDDGIGIWKHVLRGMDREKLMAGIFNPKDLSKQYGIATLPTKILVDREGNIIGRFEGGDRDDEKMDAQLKSLLGNN